MKVKEVWFAAFSIFATISFYQGSSYLVPYLSDVYGMTAEHAGIIGMIRAYVLAILIAPVVGLLADKVGSAIKVMNWLFVYCRGDWCRHVPGDPTGSGYGMGPDRHPDDCRLH